MLNQQGQYQNNNKMDTLFFNSIKRAEARYNNKKWGHLAKFILLLVFHIVDSSILNSPSYMLFHYMRFGMAVSIINLFINMIIRCAGYGNKSSNNRFLLDLAKAMGHCTPY